jgi:hypothetical protein
MPEYKCVFVKEDKETVIDESETKIIHADTARAAAAIYKLEAMDLKGKVLIGPIVRTCDENGQERFFHDSVSFRDRKLSPQKESQTTSTKTEKKEVQLSLTETNKLLKELIKEQKSTNGKLDRLHWLLAGLTAAAIMPIYRLLKKWDSL